MYFWDAEETADQNITTKGELLSPETLYKQVALGNKETPLTFLATADKGIPNQPEKPPSNTARRPLLQPSLTSENKVGPANG